MGNALKILARCTMVSASLGWPGEVKGLFQVLYFRCDSSHVSSRSRHGFREYRCIRLVASWLGISLAALGAGAAAKPWSRS